ncbi:MAG: citrate synthase [Bacteroidetes bacterium]|nr:citrate synthase [Bacteroidota bacterium]
MAENATLQLGGQSFDLPVVTGTENEKAIDITQLRAKTGYITLDNGYMNTGATQSSITFLDGEQGILRYRGIPIEQLAEHSTFVETAFLLIYGKLPNREELNKWSRSLTENSYLHEDMKHFFDGYPSTSHPMAILSSMVNTLSSYYPMALKPDLNEEEKYKLFVLLLAKMRTIAAYSYKKSVGEPYIYPSDDLKYCANFLNMMFAHPSRRFRIDETLVRALDLILILHADHEQNCSTSTVRLVGSSKANLFASVSAGICALWGPLHGGANQEVIDMLIEIKEHGGNVKSWVEKAKDKNSGFRLFGFGHRVYKNFDPRARIIKKAADDVLDALGIDDPLLDIAKELEAAALSDQYFIDKKLYPNVDFYSGIILKAMGIPVKMFTVMFAIGRLPGWLAHWKEMGEAPDFKIGRPRQIYTGPNQVDYVPMDLR